MSSIDTRSRDILLTLLTSSSPITVKNLAEKLNLSVDSVKYSLRQVNYWLRLRNLAIENNSAIGVSIDLGKNDRTQIISELKKLESFSLTLSPIERQRYILLTLLTQEEPVLSKQLAIILGVSRPTILGDLDNAEKWLSQFQISLDRRPGWGFTLIGKELDIRHAIEIILLETIGEVSLLALYQGEHKSFFAKVNDGNQILTPIPFTLNSLNLDFCGHLVEKIEELSNFYFSDSSHVSLALFLSILISRVKENRKIEPFSEDLILKINARTLEISKEITHRISQRFKIQVSYDEMVNIAMRMLSIRSRQTLSSEDFSIDETLSSDVIENIVLQMIQEASKILHPILSIDQKLKRGLLVHMKPAINRLIFNLPIRNLLLPEIKAKYPYIFMVSEKSAKILEENIGCSIPEEEIGFIAMHFAAAMERLRTVSDTRIKTLVVCGGGCATAWMLVSRIQAEFPELEVLKVCSVLELSERSLKGFGVDLIISTIPLENIDIPTVVVSPLLSEKERDDVKSEIDEIGDKKSTHNNFLASDSGFSITSLLNKNTIQTDVAAVDWRDAIVKSCQPLIEQGDIDEKYVGGIEDLLVKHGPYMVLAKEVVLLHAMIGYGVNKVCMSLSTYSPPVNFGHPSNDPVSVGIVFGTVDGRSHLKALSQLSRLLGDQEFIFQLKKSANAQEIIDLLSNKVNKH